MTPQVLGGLSLAVALAAAYARGWERRWLQVTRKEIALDGLPAAIEGLTIAHLSDIHYGPMTPLGVIRRAVDAANALAPDAIALTGDFIDHRPAEVGPVARELGRLRAPLGVWAVLGGHDLRAGEHLSRRAFQKNGIHLLLNQATALVEGAAPLWIAGVRDNSEYYLDRIDHALAGVPRNARTLLLAHSPDIIEEAAARGVDLVLSGHTHGGQICLPFFGPLVTESRYWRRFARGLNRAGNTWIHTARGIGVVRLRARFLSRPEVALLRLVRAPVARRAPEDEELARTVAARPR